MAISSNVIYEETAVPGGRRTVMGVLGAAALAVPISVMLNLWGLFWLAVLIVLIGGILFLSLHLYSSIRVTADELVVGRDRLALTALDPAFGVQPGERALPDEVRASLEVGLSNRRDDVHILGGAWGRPKTGSGWLVIQERSGQRHVVASRHADELADVLLSRISTAST